MKNSLCAAVLSEFEFYALASQNEKNFTVCSSVMAHCYMNTSTGLSGFRSCITQNQIIKNSEQGLERYF